jgi:hypothetical protein
LDGLDGLDELENSDIFACLKWNLIQKYTRTLENGDTKAPVGL